MITTTEVTLKALLTELVAMPTLTAEPAICRAAVDWIRYQLKDLPLHFYEQTLHDHTSLIVTTRSTKRPALMLHAHLDIAPDHAGGFNMKERDGKYFGRGVFDMKYAAAAYIKLLQDLGPDLPKYDLGVTFTTDEETTSSEDGAGSLAAQGWGGSIMINPDAVGDWGIQRAAKGLLRIGIKSTGEPGHGSRPWQYRSAISQLSSFLSQLAAGITPEPCGDPEHAHHSLNVGVFHGGEIANQVAGSAYAEIDLRIMPGTSVADGLALVQRAAAGFEHIQVKLLASGEPIEINSNSPEVRRVAGTIHDVTGVRPKYFLAHGGSESGHYMAQGVPVIMFGPPGGGHHSDNEWIDAPGVDHFLEILHRYARTAALV